MTIRALSPEEAALRIKAKAEAVASGLVAEAFISKLTDEERAAKPLSQWQQEELEDAMAMSRMDPRYYSMGQMYTFLIRRAAKENGTSLETETRRLFDEWEKTETFESFCAELDWREKAYVHTEEEFARWYGEDARKYVQMYPQLAPELVALKAKSDARREARKSAKESKK